MKSMLRVLPPALRSTAVRWLLVLLAAVAPLPAQAARGAQFQLALPGYHWQFPRDHFAHPAFANEWWYFTGNLTAANGDPLGFDLTFFRISPFPGADLNQDFYLAHFAISDIARNSFHFDERARRGLWRQAGFQTQPGGGFRLFNENWQLTFGADGPRNLDAVWGGMALHLSLGRSPILFEGPGGLSRKGPGRGQASYYYSMPRLGAQGTMRADGRIFDVHGLVWMDHEFATNQLAQNQQGWDWMGLQLRTAGAGPARDFDLMLFQLRQKDGSRDPHSAATLRMTPAGARGGEVVRMGAAGFEMTPVRWWRSPVTKVRYPVAWHVAIPGRQVDLEVQARMDNQELRTRISGVTYWEGAVQVKGTVEGMPVASDGYLELTGYGQALRALQQR